MKSYNYYYALNIITDAREKQLKLNVTSMTLGFLRDDSLVILAQPHRFTTAHLKFEFRKRDHRVDLIFKRGADPIKAYCHICLFSTFKLCGLIFRVFYCCCVCISICFQRTRQTNIVVNFTSLRCRPIPVPVHTWRRTTRHLRRAATKPFDSLPTKYTIS